MADEILIVDDERDICSLVSDILQDEGHATRAAHDSSEALAQIEARRPALVLLDIWLQNSEMDGIGILQAVKKSHPDLPVVMMSGHGTVETAAEAIRLGAYDFIEKPFKVERLLTVTGRALETAALKRENTELRLRAGQNSELIGRSQVVGQLRQTIERVAPTNSRVLITGPAGSGKEVVARMLHAQSKRASGPFVVVNCATMAPDRVEAVLFGSEQGETRVGMFERAHGGTLLLDEVIDMPLETQGKIVRILQEQVFERVGGASRVEVDVRVVAAASRDPAEEIASGNFREDLFYRLNVVPIHVPSLADRREDIPLLAEYFLQAAAEAASQPLRVLGEDALADLRRYAWPGNVRELRNIMERLLILAPGDADEPLGADILPLEITQDAPKLEGIGIETDLMGLPLREARENFEREYLLAQVARFDGNVSKTAAFIGMERSALHRKLKSLGVHTLDKAKGGKE